MDCLNIAGLEGEFCNGTPLASRPGRAQDNWLSNYGMEKDLSKFGLEVCL